MENLFFMSKGLDIQIKDLVIPSNKAFFESYIYESKLPGEKRYGKVLAVFEIGIEKEKALEIFKIITSHLNRGLSRNPSDNFETALNKINEALASLAQKGEVGWIEKCNVSLLCIKEESITLSCLGKAKIILLREGNLIDISEGVAAKSPSPVKTFSNIVSGSIQPQDKLVLTTLPLFEVMPQEKLKRILKQSPPDMICSLLKKELPNINLSALVAEIKKAEEFKEVKPTDEIRYPSLQIEETKPEETKERLAGLHNITDKFIKGGATQTSQIFRKAQKIIETGKPSRTFRGPQIGFFNIKWEESKKFFKDVPKNFQRLPKTSKILLLSALVFLVLFCGSIATLSCKRKETVKLVQYEDLINQARDKEKAASDALIYKDREKAKTLLVEAKGVIDEILKEKGISEKQKQELEILLSKIQTNIDKAEHIIRITDPQTLANFEEDETLNLQRLIRTKDEIYSFNSATNAVLKLDEENRQMVTLPVSSQDLGHLVLGTSLEDKNKIIFYTDTPAIAELDIEENKLGKIEIEFAHQDQNIQDISTYLNKIYLLDIAHNQIYKHSRTISGYSRGSAWLNKEINLANAQSLAIDGNVWILTSDGIILKFLTGDLLEFTYEQLAQPLNSPTRMITSLDLEHLYIMDPKNKRIVVSDKNGGLINQYISDSFDDLKDVYVNEKEGKMYVLNGKRIYEIGLEGE